MKAKFSGVGIVDGRGKINGSVASKNKTGAYVRTKVTPLNPRTAAQVAVRFVFGMLSAMWRTISQTQRDSWNSLAASVPYRDIFGDSRFINGNSFFVKANTNLNICGISPLTDAPSWVLPTNEVELSCNIGAGSVILDSNILEVPAGCSMVVQATPSLSPGRLNVNNRFRQVTVFNEGDAFAGVDIFPQYSTAFGAPIVSQRVSIRCFLIKHSCGAAGLKAEATDIVS